MSSPSSSSMNIARQLIALELTHGELTGRTKDPARHLDHGIEVVRVCEKLRLVLTIYTGAAGVRSLLTRALTLAKLREQSLAPVHVLENGALAGFENVGLEKSKVTNSHQRKETGGQLLVAHLLDLLVIFIGEPLMLRLVQEAWPDASARTLRLQSKDSS